jgi:hypothetical protein
MQASEKIRESLGRVATLRQVIAQQPDLAEAVLHVKQVQAQRFAGTYHDLLGNPTYAPCATFFLEELYSAKDYAERDTQFARMAGAIQRTFPESVVSTAVALAELHVLTEELDLSMARNWCQQADLTEAQRYMTTWRTVQRQEDRNWQLNTVLSIGDSLGRLTSKPGLRMMLKMMRRPAHLAGLGALQNFLESGFNHFADLTRSKGTVSLFLDTIKTRETAWITRLFDAAPSACEAELTQTLCSDRSQISLSKVVCAAYPQPGL